MRSWRFGLRILSLVWLSAASAGGLVLDFPKCVAELQRLMDIDDIVLEAPKLPADFELKFKRGESRQGFKIAEALWTGGFDAERLREILRAGAANQTLSVQDAADFRQIRAKLKQLRFAFVSFDESHEVPSGLQRLVVSMGKFQDALKNKNGAIVGQEAEKMLKITRKSGQRSLEDEIDGFKPASKKSFRKWVRGEAKNLEAAVAADELTPHEFHEGRKSISRILSAFELAAVMEPNSGASDVVGYLGTINGLMGQEHDRLIADTLAHRIDYEKDQMHMAPQIRDMIRTFLNAFEP